MGDFKSKLPDFKELTNITCKFFKDMKNSVTEIVEEYKKKREEDSTARTGEVTSSSSSPQAAPSTKEKPEDRPVDDSKNKPKT